MFTGFSANIQGIILGFFGFAFFAISDVSTKFLTQFYPVFQIVAFEASVAFLLCLIFAKPLGGFKRTFNTKQPKVHVWRGILNFTITLLAALAFSRLPMTIVYTLLFVSPFVTALLAKILFREKVDGHGWVAIAGGFLGVLIVMRPGFSDFNPWLLIPMLAAVMIAVNFLVAKSLNKDETLLSLALFSAAPAVMFVLPFVIAIYACPRPEHIWVFLVCGASLMAGLIMVAMGFQRGKASLVAPIQYLQIVFGAVFGYLIFGDMPDIWTFAGAALIIGSGIYLLETERHFKREI